MTPGPTKGATIVEFFDDPETFNSPQIQQRLEAQKHNLLRLGELVKSYDDDMARSKDFLSKVLHSFTIAIVVTNWRIIGHEFVYYRIRRRTYKLWRNGRGRFTRRVQR